MFDRVSGKPVWPIAEHAVPASDIPGEHASPTQPFPSKPPAFSPQGVTLDDAFDATPELKAEAQAEMKKYRMGPLFTPPSFKGTLMLPGMLGGANWGGAAFDPETEMLYVKSTNMAHVARVKRPDKSGANPRAAEVDADLSGDLAGTNATFHDGLPLTKPPYAYFTAIDLNHGTIAWNEAYGDWPELAASPALAGVKLPDGAGRGGSARGNRDQRRAAVRGGRGYSAACDRKATGKDLWQGALPARSYGTPMTYRTREGNQFVVIAAGSGPNAAAGGVFVGGRSSGRNDSFG